MTRAGAPAVAGIAAAIVVGIVLGAAACPDSLAGALADAPGQLTRASVGSTATAGHTHEGHDDAPPPRHGGAHHSDVAHGTGACLALVRSAVPNGAVVAAPATAHSAGDDVCASQHHARPDPPVPRSS